MNFLNISENVLKLGQLVFLNQSINMQSRFMTPVLRHGGHDHDHDEGSSDGLNVAKIVAMVCLFTASFVLGTLPIKLNKWLKWGSDAKNNSYVKIMLCFGGGVLFCTTFIHMLPEVAEGIDELDLSTGGFEIHYAEMLMCIGFFTMYFVEELVHQWLHNKEELKAVRKSLLVRRGETEDFFMGKELEHKHEHDVEHGTNQGHSHGHSHSHGKGHTHEHSHVVMLDANDKTVKTIRGLLIVLALSVHELFEGLAVGLEDTTATVWYMFGAVSAHKFVIAFCIGVELITAGMKNLLVVVYVFTFAVVSPLGIGIGIAITSSQESSMNAASTILQGLASGTLLYVVFFEVLQADRKSGIIPFFAVFIGFLVMLAITILS